MIVLVTGFGPFLKHRSNPTERLAREADGRRIGRAQVVGRVLPAGFRACERALGAAMREARPDAIVLFGLAAKRRKLSLEALALNVDHSEEPDEARARPWRRPIERGGPRLIDATLPIDRLYRALRRARIPVEVSHHAGTYVCNHAFYVAARRAGKARVGFVHVPKTMRPARLRRALELVVRTLGEVRG